MTRKDSKIWNRKVRLLEKAMAIMKQQESQRNTTISFYEAMSLFLTSGFSSNDVNEGIRDDNYLIERAA